ncbi:3'(2'),5'-bisphosphate nucleotidase CysQ [Rhizobium sp. 2YAF20]|uniref:3'(2'),5'-bisphosphate nucleotidase CysQ n=1 Tax=Rhizobium sp. 2YAF20 TaxID=3233027 RepID=UPI003F9B76A4
MRQAITSEAWIGAVLAVVQDAGKAILHLASFDPYRTGAIGFKSDDSPVTQADLAAHQELFRGLKSIDASLHILSEEGEESSAKCVDEPEFWLVDPLDGTREFLSGSGEFTVNVALVRNRRPVWGAVFAPAIDHLYWGGETFGAFRCARGNVERISVQHHVDRSSLRVTATKSHMNEQTRNFIGQFDNCELIQAGSSLKFCRVAEGTAHLYPRLGPTYEWDTAAAQAVLEGAGGVVTDMEGRRLSYGKPGLINPHFVAASSGQWSKWKSSKDILHN